MDRPKVKTITVSIYPRHEELIRKLSKAIAKELGWIEGRSGLMRLIIEYEAERRGIKP